MQATAISGTGPDRLTVHGARGMLIDRIRPLLFTLRGAASLDPHGPGYEYDIAVELARDAAHLLVADAWSLREAGCEAEDVGSIIDSIMTVGAAIMRVLAEDAGANTKPVLFAGGPPHKAILRGVLGVVEGLYAGLAEG